MIPNIKKAAKMKLYQIKTFAGEFPWLYYANRRDIRRLRVDSRYMEIIVEETDNSIALDVDYNDSRIFWTDGAAAQIIR